MNGVVGEAIFFFHLKRYDYRSRKHNECLYKGGVYIVFQKVPSPRKRSEKLITLMADQRMHVNHLQKGGGMTRSQASV